MAMAVCLITATAASTGAASLFAAAGIGAVMAGNISGATEDGRFGQESPGPQKIDRQILLAPAAPIDPIPDAPIFSRSVS